MHAEFQDRERRTARDGGFSLIEVLNVVMIIGVLAALAIPMVLSAVQRARETAVVAYLKSWPAAIELFYVNTDRYPASLAELEASGYLSQAGPSLRNHYTFTVVQKVAGAPSASVRMAGGGPAGSWWSTVREWSLVGTAWAAHKPDHKTGPPAAGGTGGEDKDKGHGNNPDGCDPDNPGKGGGGPCGPAGDAGTGGDGGNAGDPGGGAPGAGGGNAGAGAPAGGAGGGAGTRWEGWANPVSGQGKHFYIDDSGTIRFSMDGPAGTDSPAI